MPGFLAYVQKNDHRIFLQVRAGQAEPAFQNSSPLKMCPWRKMQIQKLPLLCVGLDSPVAAQLLRKPVSLGTFCYLIVGLPFWQKHPNSRQMAGIQNSSPAQGMLAAVTDIGEGKDKANRANRATLWKHMFFSEPCMQL